MDKLTESLKKSWAAILEKEHLIGGLSDNKTLDDIFKKHSKEYPELTLEKLKQQYEKGVEVETEEHTSNPEIAGEIARDHLWEYPYYYTTLKQMEDGWGK